MLQSQSHQHPVAFHLPTFTTNPFSPQNNLDHQLNASQQVLGRHHQDSSSWGQVPKRLREITFAHVLPSNLTSNLANPDTFLFHKFATL
jgi:hypothetical protein